MLMFFLIFFFCFVLFFSLCTSEFTNPYTLIFYFGKKGSGKTTELVKLAIQHLNNGWLVFSNVPIPGTYMYDPLKIGQLSFPPHSVVFIDEASISWDNRGFKSFDKKTLEWFRLQRHYKVKVYLFSQTFDVDKKLRDLTDEMYLIERRFKIFGYGKRIIKKITLTESTGDSESHISENLKFDSLLFFFAGSRSITLIPRFANLFDSFSTENVKMFPARLVAGNSPCPPSAAAVWLSLIKSGGRQLLRIGRNISSGMVAKFKNIDAESKQVHSSHDQEEIDRIAASWNFKDFFSNSAGTRSRSRRVASDLPEEQAAPDDLVHPPD